MKEFWLSFVPLFVAVDAVGVLPMFIAITQGMPQKDIRRVIIESVITATAVAFTFLFGGRALLRLLGISVADFMVAGGFLIFIIAVSDVLASEKLEVRMERGTLGAVPFGVPLISGPAVLTTSILLLDTYGPVPTAAALAANIAIAGISFLFASQLNRMLGSAGATILSKVASLLMAAIGVMMIRRGFIIILAEMPFAS